MNINEGIDLYFEVLFDDLRANDGLKKRFG